MKILLAEDDPTLAHFFSHVLSAYGSCVRVGTGLAAVEAFEMAFRSSEPFDLVVLDIMMPQGSGHDAFAEIRAIEDERPNLGNRVPVMMCSALEDAQNIFQAHSNGCVEYLVKPVKKADFARALGKLGLVAEQRKAPSTNGSM